jgi:hypothetical protein
MPHYFKIPFPTKSGMTIAKGGQLFWEWTWENSGTGPNQGPVIFTADPVSHQSGLTDLVTTDIAKCRRAPGAGGSTEVFYRFTVLNKGDIATNYNLEIITFSDLMGANT